MIDFSQRVARLEEYFEALSDEEAAICKEIGGILSDGAGIWAVVPDVELLNDKKYVVKVGEMIELATWNAETQMFFIEGQGKFLEAQEISAIYV